MSRSQEPLPLPESGAITTLTFGRYGDVETVMWTNSGPALIAEVGRVRRRWLEIADMVVDPATSDQPTAVRRTHRLLAGLSSGCLVATAATADGCVASWRDCGRFVDVAFVAAPPRVAAALVYSQLAEGKSFATDRSWTVCVTLSGITRRLVLRTVPLLG